MTSQGPDERQEPAADADEVLAPATPGAQALPTDHDEGDEAE
ncbi:hypothetical protein [Mycolicibacterium hippocampi]